MTSLKTELGLTDGNLGRHLQVLSDAGMVTTERTFFGSRPRTIVRATQTGLKAFHAEVTALRALLDRVR